MSTALAARPSRPSIVHPQSVPARPRRVSLPDRIALRIGIALVQWSRRPRVIVTRASIIRRREAQHDRRRREQQWQHAALLILPPR
ncbi:hypothetical protein OVN18_01265 [Microcella daejeonensis]|jgi:hypothetical protein|uniref:Uncharacterized protein n=1 Tax=Microcella daejeonensis TaxID=2994971 RepID=A0A9E8MLG3_9MICO|nr:hypothetical protein [Microcella daejeonensis]WAB81678.1 hypothetical protein OVN18_01265 [Microcella daejeonensis]